MKKIPCEKCGGNGYHPNHPLNDCPTCSGTGQVYHAVYYQLQAVFKVLDPRWKHAAFNKHEHHFISGGKEGWTFFENKPEPTENGLWFPEDEYTGMFDAEPFFNLAPYDGPWEESLVERE